jgi:anaerobic magnesium-protoporphyrin IX monomethyl ester cyclase
VSLLPQPLVTPSRLASKIKAHAALENAAGQPPIVMIIPPSVFLLDERVFMSLGILKVAAVLERAGCKVEMLDLAGIENYLDVVETHLRPSRCTHVLITVTTPQLPATFSIVERIRAVRPDLRIVAGGPHVTLTAAAVKLEKKANRQARAHAALAALEQTFDVLVAGDGELAVFDALVPNASKLIDGDDNRGPLFMTNAIYEESPLPARHLVDVESYKYSIEGQKATSYIGQLGCPMKCSFCGGRNSKALRVIRARSSQSIVDELEMLYKQHGFTAFMNYEDELNINKKAFLESLRDIRKLQDRLGVEFRLRGFVKAELFDEEQAEAMFAAGFRWILSGFEAAHERILENIQKNATIADNTRVVVAGRKYGLKTKALMSVGHAGESEETILAVRDWLIEVRPEDFDCTVITVYPGTPYYDEALEETPQSGIWTYTCKKSGDKLHAYDVDFTKSAGYYKGDPNAYKSFVFTDYLTAERIVELRNVVERDVRAALGIPFNASNPAVRYEHSMGAAPGLPDFILRTSTAATVRAL